MPFLIRCLTWALECAVREGYAFFSECFSCGALHRVKLHANQSIMMLGSIYISVGLALAKLLNLQIILELKFPKITLK